MLTSDFIDHLKMRLQAKHLLQHPFYRSWEAGTLPAEALKRYAEQYYHLEKNFPRFLSRTHSECADPFIRQTITDNLYDEEHGQNNHRELWLRFADALGCDRAGVQNAAPLPETAATIAAFERLAADSTLSGIAALTAYEAQIPEVSKTKIAGLQKFYGVTGERGLMFFKVHGILDIKHADAWWNIIQAEATTPALQQRAEAALVKARDALWGFLDGICRAYLPAM